MGKRRFLGPKGHFNGQEFTVFMWRNSRGNFTSVVSPEAGSKCHLFDTRDSNIYLSHETSKDYLLARVRITGDNSRDGFFTTFFGEVLEEISFDTILNEGRYYGTTTYGLYHEDNNVGVFLTRGCVLETALVNCMEGFSSNAEAEKERLETLASNEEAPPLFRMLAKKKLK